MACVAGWQETNAPIIGDKKQVPDESIHKRPWFLIPGISAYAGNFVFEVPVEDFHDIFIIFRFKFDIIVKK